jgi:hypothetical protein
MAGSIIAGIVFIVSAVYATVYLFGVFNTAGSAPAFGLAFVAALVAGLLSLSVLLIRTIERRTPRGSLRFAGSLCRLFGMAGLLVGLLGGVYALVVSLLNANAAAGAAAGQVVVPLQSSNLLLTPPALTTLLAALVLGAFVYGFGALLNAIARIEEDQRAIGRVLYDRERDRGY